MLYSAFHVIATIDLLGNILKLLHLIPWNVVNMYVFHVYYTNEQCEIAKWLYNGQVFGGLIIHVCNFD